MKFLLSTLVTFSFAVIGRAADFTVVNTNPSGPGSLSQAIIDANAAPGRDNILFNIPGAGPHKIIIAPNGLPEITDPLVINGYTQPGAAPNTQTLGDNAIIKIQIDGATNLDRALVFKAGTSGSEVYGLSITGLVTINGNGPYPSGGAICLIGAGNTAVEGNFLGLLPDGTTVSGGPAGVEIVSNGNQIGGTAPAARNVITGNNYGIVLDSPNGNKVEGNFLGTDASGTKLGTDPGGTQHAQGIGIFVVSGDHSDTIIGGTAPEAGNIISGHLGGPAIKIGTASSPANDVVVAGNAIGVGADGSALANVGGITIYGSRNVIGGLDPAAGNTIMNNAPAVTVLNGANNLPSIGNRILSNLMNRNIDLGGDGLTTNDLGDYDTGPNNLQNFPVFTRIDPPASNGDVTFHGDLNSAPSSDFLLQFFSLKNSDKPRLLGNLTVTINSSGHARFDFVAPGFDLVKGSLLFVTATDSQGNTSEFNVPGGFVQLANISTRANIGTGDNTLIGGFVLHLSNLQTTRLIIRALGPSLNLSNHLADPSLELYDEHGALIAKNDDWRSTQQQMIIDSGVAPSSDLESAILISLPNGSYTAQVRGAHGETGVGIVEIYDLDPIPTNDIYQLVNLSTRGFVGLNDDALIGGVIVRGNYGQRLIIRAIGPDLTAIGLPGALPDPILELRDESGTLLATNDNWRDTQAPEIENTQLAPNDNRDSAILTNLPPGLYTAVVRGKQNATGLAVVEFYKLTATQSGTSSEAAGQ